MAEQTSYYDNKDRSSVQMVYDSKTDTWVPVTAQNSNGGDASSNSGSASSSAAASTASSATGSGAKSASTVAAEKQVITSEFNTLTGEMVVTPGKKTIRLIIGTTILIEGLGKYLSGQYFIKDRKLNVSNSDGLSITLTVIKTGFGATLKSPPEETRVEEVPKEEPTAVKVGDKIEIFGDAVYGHAHEGVKVPSWVKENSKKGMYTVTQIDTAPRLGSAVICVLVQNINSWVHIDNVKPL